MACPRVVCFVFSLQSGVILSVVILCTIFIGMGVMTLYTIVVLTSEDEAELYYVVAIVIAYTHSTLIIVSIACAFVGAYTEKPSLMLAGGAVMISGIIVYFIASVLSYSSSTFRYACIGNRCPDHVWLQESYWRYHYLQSSEKDGSLSMMLKDKDREENLHYKNLPGDLEVGGTSPTARKSRRKITVRTTTTNSISTSFNLNNSPVSTARSTERTSTEAVLLVEPTTVQGTVVDNEVEKKRILIEKGRKLKKKAGNVDARLEVDSRRLEALGSNAIPDSLIDHTMYSPLGRRGESSTQKSKTNGQAKGTLPYTEAMITITSRQQDYDLLEIPTILNRRMRDAQSRTEVLEANGILNGNNNLPYSQTLTTLDSPRKVIMYLNQNNAIKNASLNIKKSHDLNITSHNHNNLKKMYNDNRSDRPYDWINKKDLNISLRFVKTLIKRDVKYWNLQNPNLSETNTTESISSISPEPTSERKSRNGDRRDGHRSRSQTGLQVPYKYIKHPTLDLVISIIFNISYLAFLTYTTVIYLALYEDIKYGVSRGYPQKESLLR